MRISSTASYALHLLICLAEPQELQQPISASELSQQTGISEKFIRRILRILNDAGMVKSVRGIAGGHLLSVPKNHITLASIIRAVEGGVAIPPAQDDAETHDCRINETWQKAAMSIEQSLELFTLENIMAAAHTSPAVRLSEENKAVCVNTHNVQTRTSPLGEYHAKTRSLGRQRSQKR